MVGRRQTWFVRLAPVTAVLAVLAGAANCTTTPRPPAGPPPIEVGMSGAFGVGALAHDEGVRRQVSALLGGWRPPLANTTTDLPFSRLLFADRVDGTLLAVAAAKVADSDSYWIVEASGPDPAHLSITADTSYVGGLLGKNSLVPVRSPCCGQRYLAGSAISGVRITGGVVLGAHGGLSDRTPTQRCTPRAIEFQPTGANTGYLDLGPGVAPITTPMLGQSGLGADQRLTTAEALRGLDTCRASTDSRGVITTAVGGATVPAALTAVGVSSGASVTLPAAGLGTITNLTWYLTSDGRAASAVWRPDGNGPPVFSPAEKSQDIQVLPLDLPGGRITELTWSEEGATLSLSQGVQPVFQTSGLVVLADVPKDTTAVLVKNGQQQVTRTIG